MSISPLSLDAVEYAVVSLETTGLMPGRDRVVELAIASVSPGHAPRLEFTSVIDPERPLAGSSVHGLEPDDLVGAPRLAALAGALAPALIGKVVVAHNAQHALRFFHDELARIGLRRELPHLCSMYLRCILGGERLSLADACHVERIAMSSERGATGSALATASLLTRYLDRVRKGRLAANFGELVRGQDYVFCRSLANSPIGSGELAEVDPQALPRPRSRSSIGLAGVGRYQDAVLAALGDLDVSDAEIDALGRLRGELTLSDEVAQAVHARVFGLMIELVAHDDRLDESERAKLARIHAGLRRLGWAPGD
ncbi:PolC-type DNA polymerase III [Nannocystaceae bacterium ST9]